MSNKHQMQGLSDCLGLIRSARVMILGTAEKGEPWTAPVYYLYESKRFYFFSSPKARHILEGEGIGCAASVFYDSSKIQELKGVQMTGQIQRCASRGKALRLAAGYAVKYGIPVPAKQALDYFLTGFGAVLYGFIPEKVYFMDNSSGFGNRALVEL